MPTLHQMHRLDGQNVGLISGSTKEHTDLPDANTTQPREAKYGLLQGVINKINSLFAGTVITKSTESERPRQSFALSRTIEKSRPKQ